MYSITLESYTTLNISQYLVAINNSYIWGSLFEMGTPNSTEEIPRASFKYWISATNQTYLTDGKMGAKKFHVVNFDNLSCNDENEILCPFFSEFENFQINFDKINTLIKMPKTIQRYLELIYSWLNENNRYELMNFGFLIKEKPDITKYLASNIIQF